MTAKHKRLVAKAERLVNRYKKAVDALNEFKGKHCREGDTLAKTGAKYDHIDGTWLGRKASPDHVLLVFGKLDVSKSFYPLVSAIREDVEK